MYKLLALILLILFLVHAPKAPAACDIDAGVQEMARVSPAAYNFYQKVKTRTSKNGPNDTFKMYFKNTYPETCAPATALHEAGHVMAGVENLNGYPLINGGTTPRAPESSAFFPPSKIHSQFAKSDALATEEQYLSPKAGGPESRRQFDMLLDEFNEHTWDAQITADYLENGGKSEHILLANPMMKFMAFVSAYADHAKGNSTLAALKADKVKATIAALWKQSQEVLTRICKSSKFNVAQDRKDLERVCKLPADGALSEIVKGQLVGCPAECKARLAGSPVTGNNPSPPPSVVDGMRPPAPQRPNPPAPPPQRPPAQPAPPQRPPAAPTAPTSGGFLFDVEEDAAEGHR